MLLAEERHAVEGPREVMLPEPVGGIHPSLVIFAWVIQKIFEEYDGGMSPRCGRSLR